MRAAQAWCQETTQDRTMDPDLATAFASILEAEISLLMTNIVALQKQNSDLQKDLQEMTRQSKYAHDMAIEHREKEIYYREMSNNLLGKYAPESDRAIQESIHK